ncbi:MAG TPA: hypothetical protein VHT04_12445 [Stellaceae bacterium]|jgi:hypothetical protein|nr:hypothetical protein [Stellaceae bacterium]
MATTPEDRARAFAARWFRNESPALQEIGRREIAALIRAAVEAEKAQSAARLAGDVPKVS